MASLVFWKTGVKCLIISDSGDSEGKTLQNLPRPPELFNESFLLRIDNIQTQLSTLYGHLNSFEIMFKSEFFRQYPCHHKNLLQPSLSCHFSLQTAVTDLTCGLTDHIPRSSIGGSTPKGGNGYEAL